MMKKSIIIVATIGFGFLAGNAYCNWINNKPMTDEAIIEEYGKIEYPTYTMVCKGRDESEPEYIDYLVYDGEDLIKLGCVYADYAENIIKRGY